MKPIHLIAGLGNPGPEYEGTRHNAGFDVVEALASRFGAAFSSERKLFAKTCRINRPENDIVLCLPQTFMNLSGKAIQATMAWYGIETNRLIVSVDDADLDLGTIRLRPEGSSGGHHGLESIEKHLKSRQFARQKIGIGRHGDGRRDIAGYVLGRYDASDRPLFDRVVDRAVQQIECWIESGSETAMSRFNGKTNIDNQL